MLLGRDSELRLIELALAQARVGESSTVSLVGEPGIGKTALLDAAAELGATARPPMQLLRARGIESEAEIPFASLLELVRPALGLLGTLPVPQAAALEAALALAPARSQERFAIGAATLTLLAAYSDRGPVAILIDDAQWLDQPSAQAILFALRRLVADPIATVIAVREGEPSLLDETDLPRTYLGGLTAGQATVLLEGLGPDRVAQLHAATSGNPLAMLELAPDAEQLVLAPEGAPILVSARIADAFVRRAAGLDDEARAALVLVATDDSGDLATLGRAAGKLGIELAALARAEQTGLIRLVAGGAEFRHPLARSAIYAQAGGEQRRAAHRALAASLPDRDYDRRAWHLASAAIGTDAVASSALEQAATRARDRSAYATATAAYERSALLAEDDPRRARLLLAAADTSWLAGLPDRATALLVTARAHAAHAATLVGIDRLAGHIAVRRGPVMDGYAILTDAAERADPELAVEMLAEAVTAGFAAGEPATMLSIAQRATALMPDSASEKTRLIAAVALGMAHILGGDAAAGAAAIRDAGELAERQPALGQDPELVSWLALVANFARDASTGRSLLEDALSTARANAAIGGLPFVLNLVARHHGTADNWPVAEAHYREAIALARETDQLTDLAFGLAGLAWLQARRGREFADHTSEVLALCKRLGTRIFEVWLAAAEGELALGLGDPAGALHHFGHQSELLLELGITDPDLSPAPELVDAYLRLGRRRDAEVIAPAFIDAAREKARPWPVARALRCEALLADDDRAAELFERALAEHERTPDAFERARTQLAYGERLRRARDRILAREQLRAAVETFEALGAEPWAERARAELAATGETLRRRDPATVDELTPQELQIALLLVCGKTTREAAAALFLSPKTIEYHLRHVYLKLSIHSREELARALAGQSG
jgi:DNA-binding CsgD family transcriptional regulator